MKSSEIRQKFLDYFASKGHAVVASSSLVPHEDPTLLFTNAGMNQFKDVFLGFDKRPYTRATTSQKCVRAGGKHNDLENVGYTARHHTFFEMLGNFSFGDYFKREAISYAWELLTEVYRLPSEKLWITVYAEDDEAYDIWTREIGVPPGRVIRIGDNKGARYASDNFWMMGDTGPCGPCTEIFYDHGEHVWGGPPGSPDEDGDRYIEIWNNVFMQFNRDEAGVMHPLPKPSVDTGMGLERISAVLQNVHSNYEIDLFQALIRAAARETNCVDLDSPSLKVLADHIRACSFLISDGVIPGNEGRGYVLRRIMRRAMRHAHLMGCTEPLMWKLVPALAAEMGQAYPELLRAQALITETLRLEETRFKATLDKGLKLLDEEVARLPSGTPFPGETAFRLYDTYGFPLDLTQDALKARRIDVDTDGFNAAMARQRAEARKAWSGSGEAATEALWFEIREKVGATEFLGYDTVEAEGKIVALVENGQTVEAVHPGHEVMLVVNQTPFYGESGGQEGDTGTVAVAGGKARLVVRDTLKKLGDLMVHVGTVEGGPIAVGEEVRLEVDAERRDAIRAHHSATHLLHAALRRTLGEHVTQKGSLVGPDRLRFDISHPKPLSAEETRTVEREVNRQIRRNREVGTQIMTPDAAIEAGAMALFGEKYGDEVRVVSMGGEDTGPHFSVELCGGTHVRRTGDIGALKIVAESAVAAGVRRIEAVAGGAFIAWAEQQEDLLARAADALKAAPADIPARIGQLLDDRRKLERDLAETRKQLATGGGAGPAAKQVNGITFAGRVLDGVPAKDLKGMADEIKKQIGSGVVALISTDGGKASLVVAVSEDLAGRYDAVALVKTGAEAVGGKGGGGRPDMAQAGGPDAAAAQAALDRIEAAIGG